MSTCKDCRKPVVWASTAAGLRIALDAERSDGWLRVLVNPPNADYIQVGVEGEEGAENAVVRPLTEAEKIPGPRLGETWLRSHFKTCKAAANRRSQ